MSFIDSVKGKKTLIIAVMAASAAVIALVALFLPSGVKKTEVNEEVISKRAKLEPQAPEQALPPVAAPQPGAVTRPAAPQTPPVAAETRHAAARPGPEAQKTKEPASGAVPDKGIKQVPEESGKKEVRTEEAKKTVKAEKAGPETGKTKAKQKTSSSRLSAVKSKPWAVNIASFPDEGSAKQLVASLRSAGYNAYTTGTIKNGKTWHRVRVGFYHTRGEAEKAGRTIDGKLHTGSPWVVKPAKNEAAGHIGQ